MSESEDPKNNDSVSPPAITPAQILRMAKGFSRIFWGIFLMISLFLGQAALEVFHGLRIPAYIAGAASIGWGVWFLQTAGPISRNWQRRAQMALILASLAVYFAPFTVWWKAMPYANLFLVNVLALLLTGMGILLLVNLLTADAFILFKERGNQIESQVFALGVVIMMIAPFIVGLISALVGTIHYESKFSEEIWLTVNRVPPWLYIAATLPCSLTLVAAWKAKALCYRQLWTSGAQADNGCRTGE